MPAFIRKSRSKSGASIKSRRDIFPAVGWQVLVRTGLWSPPTDAYETEDAYIVRVEIAGMLEEDIEITIEEKLLLISGIRPDVPERRAYQRMEIRFGKFETAIELPGPIDLDSSHADYLEGFLTVFLTKTKLHNINIVEEK